VAIQTPLNRLDQTSRKFLVGLTLQHKNRDVLVEGPEIEIVRVRTRHLTAGGSR
jgi:hypothetical protein